ncbi:DsrE family protein [Myxococcota bacterium]|nr:DsrE family protein [Myxococcota bacterium]
MAKNLFILNDAPYGTERSYNGLRLAGALARREGEEVRVFLMGDAASCARAGQKVPSGYYNLEVMLGSVARHGGQIGVCGTCMDARGLGDEGLAGTARRSTLDELTAWTQWAEKVLVY